MMKSLVDECIRWDNLRSLLLQKRPNPFSEWQSDDAFMKLLQSIEAEGLIVLRYDPTQKTYYVARPQEDREERSSTTSPIDVDSGNVIALEVNAETASMLWTQPRLF